MYVCMYVCMYVGMYGVHSSMLLFFSILFKYPAVVVYSVLFYAMLWIISYAYAMSIMASICVNVHKGVCHVITIMLFDVM